LHKDGWRLAISAYPIGKTNASGNCRLSVEKDFTPLFATDGKLMLQTQSHRLNSIASFMQPTTRYNSVYLNLKQQTNFPWNVVLMRQRLLMN
jgi:hypothetical protein